MRAKSSGTVGIYRRLAGLTRVGNIVLHQFLRPFRFSALVRT
jgi:hypothetical protein